MLKCDWVRLDPIRRHRDPELGRRENEQAEELPACARRPSPLIKFGPILNLWFHVDPGSRERRPDRFQLGDIRYH